MLQNDSMHVCAYIRQLVTRPGGDQAGYCESAAALQHQLQPSVCDRELRWGRIPNEQNQTGQTAT